MRSRNGDKMPRWTKFEEDMLIKMYVHNMSVKDIAQILKRTFASVNQKIIQCAGKWNMPTRPRIARGNKGNNNG